MKQSTAKTLGVAVLGAAFTAAGAGAAQALPSVSEAANAINTVNQTVPTVQSALSNTLQAAGPTMQELAPTLAPKSGKGGSTGVGSLLGGLPVNGITPAKTLPLPLS